MKLEQALFLVFAVVSVACSSSTSSVPTATPSVVPTPTATPGVVATPTATPSVVATPTATPSVVATPTATPSVVATPTATPSVVATPTATPSVVATPTATPSVVATPTARHGVVTTPTASPGVVAIPTASPDAASTDPIVIVEFPAWVEESPKMAQHIATSDVIAKAKFVSLDSTTKRHDSWGYVAELIYKFEVVQYLKGDGADELVVRMSSGPKYIAFPDWLDTRTESEALELAQSWLGRSINIVGNKRDAILLVGRSGEGEDYYFRSSDDGEGRGGYPTIGETWLAEDKASMYRHQFTDKKSATISLSDLNARIEDMRPLMEGDYAPCVAMALYYRTRVRDQLLGVYRELTLGGYREPEAFPQYMAVLDSEAPASATVFRFQRPPYRSPRFSDYWLDGTDKDLFAIDAYADATYSYEGLRTAPVLPQGEYSVHYSQFHRSLPCDEPFPYYGEAWRNTDTTEWVVNVTAP